MEEKQSYRGTEVQRYEYGTHRVTGKQIRETELRRNGLGNGLRNRLGNRVMKQAEKRLVNRLVNWYTVASKLNILSKYHRSQNIV